jgi:hypothetical protein
MSSKYVYNVRCNGVEYDGSSYFVTSTPRKLGPDTIQIVENGSIAIIPLLEAAGLEIPELSNDPQLRVAKLYNLWMAILNLLSKKSKSITESKPSTVPMPRLVRLDATTRDKFQALRVKVVSGKQVRTNTALGSAEVPNKSPGSASPAQMGKGSTPEILYDESHPSNDNGHKHVHESRTPLSSTSPAPKPRRNPSSPPRVLSAQSVSVTETSKLKRHPSSPPRVLPTHSPEVMDTASNSQGGHTPQLGYPTANPLISSRVTRTLFAPTNLNTRYPSGDGDAYPYPPANPWGDNGSYKILQRTRIIDDANLGPQRSPLYPDIANAHYTRSEPTSSENSPVRTSRSFDDLHRTQILSDEELENQVLQYISMESIDEGPVSAVVNNIYNSCKAIAVYKSKDPNLLSRIETAIVNLASKDLLHLGVNSKRFAIKIPKNLPPMHHRFQLDDLRQIYKDNAQLLNSANSFAAAVNILANSSNRWKRSPGYNGEVMATAAIVQMIQANIFR